MKRYFYLSLISLLGAGLPLRAQDATGTAARQEAAENYNILRGNIDTLTESNAALQKRIQSLEREIAELRAQVSKPTGNYASTDDVKRLAETIKAVDEKRVADNDRVIKELGNLGKSLQHTTPTHVKDTPHADDTPASTKDTAQPTQPTFTYTIKDGDYLSTICKAYKEKGVNVTVDQILAANPGLKATALSPGKKIKIPDTRVATNQ